MNIEHSEMISFGAGVNSVAMTIMLVNDGWRGPIVFADPGAEHPDTYCYLDYFEREWLRPRGLEVTRISPLTHPELYRSDYLMTLIEKCKHRRMIPLMFTRWCTAEYKRDPLAKWAAANEVRTQLIGIAHEESHRARFDVRYGIVKEYPLVDDRVNRAQCKVIIEAEGLAVPPKSGCWLCPFQTLAEWRALYDLRPDLFAEAVSLEQAAHKRAGRLIKLAEGAGYSVLQLQRQWDAQLELPLMPDPEYEYQMCECRL